MDRLCPWNADNTSPQDDKIYPISAPTESTSCGAEACSCGKDCTGGSSAQKRALVRRWLRATINGDEMPSASARSKNADQGCRLGGLRERLTTRGTGGLAHCLARFHLHACVLARGFKTRAPDKVSGTLFARG